MNVLVALILFSGVITFIAVRTRAAGVALISGVFCVLLVCSIFTGLAGAIAQGTQFAGDQGAAITNTVTGR